MEQSRNILVMKFGGTSVGSIPAMQQVVDIVQKTRQNWPRLVVVTSALSGITDLLLKSAQEAAAGNTALCDKTGFEIIRRHDLLVESLVSDSAHQENIKEQIRHLVAEFNDLCRQIFQAREASPYLLDAVSGLGERMAVRVLAGALESSGVPAEHVEATQLIVTNDQFMNAQPEMKTTQRKTCQVLLPLLEKTYIPVVTGFIAATQDGVSTTLGRGGSDYTAAILAAALAAKETWIWTDVDGVMTADPNLVPDARTIPELTYPEIAEMANLGAKVLHPKTIQPILQEGGVLRVRNTFNPEHPGTLLVNHHGGNGKDHASVKAVTVLRGLKWFKLAGESRKGSNIHHQLMKAAASGYQIPLIMELPYESALCFAASGDCFLPALGRLDKYQRLPEGSVRKQKVASEDADMITVICPGLRTSPGVASRIFSALDRARVTVLASSYGASDFSINLFIGSADTQNAIRSLHALIQ